MGNIYLMCKDKLRPIEKLYAQNENLVEMYKSMNNYLIKMIYGIYTFIVSLQITKYVMNKIKMLMQLKMNYKLIIKMSS